jgi:hypothetical protein
MGNVVWRWSVVVDPTALPPSEMRKVTSGVSELIIELMRLLRYVASYTCDWNNTLSKISLEHKNQKKYGNRKNRDIG